VIAHQLDCGHWVNHGPWLAIGAPTWCGPCNALRRIVIGYAALVSIGGAQ